MFGVRLIRTNRAISWFEPFVTPILATAARLIFASVLFGYYWASGLTKVNGGLPSFFSPSFNAFAQIFPRSAIGVSYDVNQATAFQTAAILVGTWAEFALPLCIVLGLFTRAASAGMIFFVLVQSTVDVIGHGAALGKFFDATPDAMIDQRAFWLFLLAFLSLRGGGPFALDRFFFKNAMSLCPDAPPR